MYMYIYIYVCVCVCVGVCVCVCVGVYFCVCVGICVLCFLLNRKYYDEERKKGIHEENTHCLIKQHYFCMHTCMCLSRE